ncbi:DNA primase [Syntrophotalea carbinolica DSM 2380]|uniref:DNA primase n=1 Tax=Syntrophotalea carbinolica (strain DSM 2380 / NBRC 103641 / GraBd1) TaxID=338963 RepID=Q3A142_SYNC1|nr:DNA primase [Syntrophotalea carbinolica]ABA89915.1 DNA primase [Syntrophotalea carbinolica DSM 2380]
MSGRIADEKVEEIRARADIVEVISSYVSLKRSGRNHVGLCPFHAEKTPSFNVNADRQIYHCFGCEVGGDVFAFLMNIEGLAFPEAVRRLGERYGIEVEEEAVSPEEEQRREERERLLRVTEVACDFYHNLLLKDPSGKPARGYLRRRGFDGDIARQFRLGWAPAAWEALANHLRDKGFDSKWARDRLGLVRAGNEGRNDYDLFRRRLLFPILDERGRPVAFGGRILEGDGPKYINSPESPIYHKARVLYGLYQARDAMRHKGEAIVVEGYFDQLALYRAGFQNTVATCGTALTPEHVRLLKRFAERVLLLFDQDEAGRKATFRAMDVLLPEGLQALVVTLDAGEDPDSFLRNHDAQKMQARLASARPVVEVFIERTLEQHGEDIEGRARAVEKILAKLRLLPGDIERDLYLKDLASRTGLDEQLLRSKALPQAVPDPAPSSVPAVRPKPAARQAVPAKKTRRGVAEKAQRILLRLILCYESACDAARNLGLGELFEEGDLRILAERALSVSAESGPVAENMRIDDLSESQKGLLSGILLEDEGLFAENYDELFRKCHEMVNKERMKQRLQQLQELMREAERGQDFTEMTVWQREFQELTRKLKG